MFRSGSSPREIDGLQRLQEPGAVVSSDLTDLTVRPINGRDELDLFTRLPYVLNEELAGDLADGHRRPAWMWVALRGDQLLGRAAWWGQPGADAPALLDVFDIDDGSPEPGRVDVGEHLLRTAMAAIISNDKRPPDYVRFVPPDWRVITTSSRAVQDRISIAERTGARLFVERLRFEWRPGTPMPTARPRLMFRPVQDQEELLAMMTAALDGTLDAHSRADLTQMSARDAAVRQYEDEFVGYSSPRDWWRIATLPDGDAVGFVIAARNDYNPIIAYIAVLPRHRGHGYIDEILAEGTRILAAQNVTRIRAATDLGNTPMAGAFARAGYVNFERALTMTWS
jgi:RimJ/RimL family protein N-acetyltransferase